MLTKAILATSSITWSLLRLGQATATGGLAEHWPVVLEIVAMIGLVIGIYRKQQDDVKKTVAEQVDAERALQGSQHADLDRRLSAVEQQMAQLTGELLRRKD